MNHDLITDRIVRFLFHVFLFYLSVINNIPLKYYLFPRQCFTKLLFRKSRFLDASSEGVQSLISFTALRERCSRTRCPTSHPQIRSFSN